MFQQSNTLVVVGILQSGQKVKISGPHSNKTAEAAKRKAKQSIRDNSHYTQIPDDVKRVRVMSIDEFKSQSEVSNPTITH